MPEPDIPVIEISPEDVKRISEEIVELPDEKINKYVEKWGLSEYAAQVISSTSESSKYFEDLQKELSKNLNEKEAATEASNWLMGTVFAIGNLNIDIKDLSTLILAFKDGLLTKNKAEDVLKECLEESKDIKEELERLEEKQKESSENIDDIISTVIEENPKAVEDYKGGKEATLGFLVGQVMQVTKGTADPNEVKDILKKELKQ